MMLRYFQVHKDGKNVNEDVTYNSLEQASLAWKHAPEGSEVVEIDAADRVISRYAAHECNQAAHNFLHPQVA